MFIVLRTVGSIPAFANLFTTFFIATVDLEKSSSKVLAYVTHIWRHRGHADEPYRASSLSYHILSIKLYLRTDAGGYVGFSRRWAPWMSTCWVSVPHIPKSDSLFESNLFISIFEWFWMHRSECYHVFCARCCLMPPSSVKKYFAIGLYIDYIGT